MWSNIKIVSALFEQCVLELIMKLSTSNLLKMYSLTLRKCVYPHQQQKISIFELKKKIRLFKQLIFNMNDNDTVFYHRLMDTC